MYQYSDSWKTPNNSIVVFRYFSYEKFHSLVKRKQLYFNEILKYHITDPKEGLIPYANSKNIGTQYLTLEYKGVKINIGGGKERYWDQVALGAYIKNYDVSVRECSFDDIVEIDTFRELKELDKVYDVK